MECVCCGSAAVTERSDRTARGYRRFRCRDCGEQFNERSAGVLNRAQYPSDIIALVVLCKRRLQALGAFGWLSRYRRLNVVYDRAADLFAGHIWIAMTSIIARRLVAQTQA